MSYMNRARRDLTGTVGGAHATGKDGRGRALSTQTSRQELDRLVWERTMKRLHLSTRVLAAILVAVLARMIILGATPVTQLTAAILAILAIASVLLARHGKRLEPRPRSQARTGRR